MDVHQNSFPFAVCLKILIQCWGHVQSVKLFPSDKQEKELRLSPRDGYPPERTPQHLGSEKACPHTYDITRAGLCGRGGRHWT